MIKNINMATSENKVRFLQKANLSSSEMYGILFILVQLP